MVDSVLEVTPDQAQNPGPMKPNPHVRKAQSGFTLIEILIAVIIVGVLLAVALPSFTDSMRKGRRSEAFAAMAALQQAQERFRSSNTTYSSALPSGIASTSSPSGYYALSVVSASATGYELLADGTGSSQANDGNCARLAIKVEGGSVQYASGSSLSWADTNPCWSR